jgi:Skp family chaperone for outer membrane proteins
MHTWYRRIAATLCAALVLAAAVLTLTAATPSISAETWRELYVRHLQAWRVEKAARLAAESVIADQEDEISRLSAEVETLSLAVDPLDSLRATREALASEVLALQSEQASLAASVTVLQSAQAWTLNECPDGYGCRGYPVKCTGSMRPTFDCDDLPVGHAFPISVEYGDIVLYDARETDCGWPAHVWFVMHRVVGVTADGYVLRGDANLFADPCIVPLSAVRAKIDHVFHGAFPENR